MKYEKTNHGFAQVDFIGLGINRLRQVLVEVQVQVLTIEMKIQVYNLKHSHKLFRPPTTPFSI